MKKRILCTVLCILLTAMLLPTAALAHANHSGWTKLQGATDSAMPATGGKYYLNNDITLTTVWQPADGTVLCLNGYALTQSEDFATIQVQSGVTFTLCECVGTGRVNHADGASGVGVDVEGVFHLENGLITDNTAKFGGGVRVRAGGQLNMSGGWIENNTAEEGGGVYVDRNGLSNAFIMSDGKIADNTSSSFGGGVYLDYQMGMTLSGNAIISGNQSTRSGSAKNENIFLFNSGMITIGKGGLLYRAWIGVTANGSVPEDITGPNDKDYSAFFFADQEHEQVVNGKDNIVTLEVGHNWVWKYDDVNHWMECTEPFCYDKSSFGPHPGFYPDHTREQTCGDCGYVRPAKDHEFTNSSGNMASPASCLSDRRDYAVCAHAGCGVVSDTITVYLPGTRLSHNCAYDLRGPTIAETCDVGCGQNASVTISAPIGQLTSDGSTRFDAQLTYRGTLIQGNNLTISYTRDGEAVTDTTAAGSYVASVTLGGKTASVTYEVKAAEESGEEEENPTPPQTGDAGHPLAYGLLLAISLMGVVSLRKSKRFN